MSPGQRLELQQVHDNGEGLKDLQGLTKLETLGLSDTAISDAGIKYLKDMKNRKAIYLGNSKVTATGITELKVCLPKANIQGP